MKAKVAALYIDPTGPYVTDPRFDAWDEARDATRYDGPLPVVAHPPCGPWGAFAWKCKQDPALAVRAVAQVRKLGGVLEHPSGSRLWAHEGLPFPGDPVDAFGGFTIQVDQVRWGHPARKRTWLYLVGIKPQDVPAIPPDRTPTHVVAPPHGKRAADGYRILGKRRRRLTPPRFAAWLATVAESARRPA